MNSFTRRCFRLPLPTSSARLARQVLRVASELAEGRLAEVGAGVRRGHGSAQWRGESPGGPDLREGAHAPLRARLFASALVDLAEGGWTIDVEGHEIHVTAPAWRQREGGGSPDELQQEKDAVRRSLVARALERMQSPGARRFIRGAEAGGVLGLVADGADLARSLARDGAVAVRPTLYPARPSDGADERTGLPLHDVYRYLRYTWSFPYESTPGRTLPFLIRDEGQPGAPVCGLLSLASPVPRLEARDASFGWCTERLAAHVRALASIEDERGPTWRHLAVALAEASSLAVAEAGQDAPRERAAAALCAFSDSLGLGSTRSAETLARAALALPRAERLQRVRGARHRLARELVAEFDAALDATTFEGLPLTRADAFEDPASAAAALSQTASAARELLRERRRERDTSKDAERAFMEILFKKKRAKLLAQLLSARPQAEKLRLSLGEPAALRGALEAACEPGSPSQVVEVAVARRRVRLLAAQVAEVNVCGAVPPYGPILGGKLAGLLALSADVAAHYHEAYAGRSGEIQAQMAGREIELSTDLVGLSTSSFFPVGSAQYNRLSLPAALGGVCWHHVGASRGVGTLHFSRATSELAAELLSRVQGRGTDRFGEGPSERIRKLRDALRLIDLPVTHLLEHGMRRPAYTAVLQRGAGFGDEPAREPYHRRGPSAADVSEHWRQRWLQGRIARQGALQAVAAQTREGVRISRLSERPADLQTSFPT